MLVLGVETSCDETAVALYDGERGLLAHTVHSQIDLHSAYGGVVPELASRDHVRKLLPLVRMCLEQADRSLDDVNALAYTAGPGLIGALLVGANFARGLAYARGLPAQPVHHMEGHLLAPLMETPKPVFPFLALLVSGGHTLLARVRGLGRYEVLGDTLDDAVGEAFDKTAKLLGLPYPGGPALAALARFGVPGRFHFPRPMLKKAGFDFSFSGLKTHVQLVYRSLATVDEQTRADIAVAFEEAAVDTLVQKSMRAVKHTGIRRLVISGGVSANRTLRERFAASGIETYFPRMEFSTDNAAMIAFTGQQRLAQSSRMPDLMQEAVRARWGLEELQPPE